MILVTGATGNVGSEVTKLLIAQGVPFRAMVRSPEETKRVPVGTGTDIVVADFDDPATLPPALAEVERAFLLTNSSERAEAQQRAFVLAAQGAGVRQIVKQSQWAASLNSPVRFLRYHAVVEDAIRASGMAYTFLRPNLFMQGLLAFRASIVQEGKFFAPAGDARVSVVDTRDIAAVAVAALTQDGHEGRIYDITGPEALTHADMAERLSRGLGRPIEFVDITPESMRESWVNAGFPAWQADGLLEDYAHYRRGEASAVASGVQEATGMAPRTFATFVQDYAQAFA
jgi:uncharacterized protein YbjT (DUF2867 family)